MRIFLVHKAEFQRRPPVISVVEILLKLGYSIILITCGIDNYNRQRLEQRGVKIYVLPFDSSGLIVKIINYYKFRKNVFHIIHEQKFDKENDLLWIEGGYTIVSLGKKIKKYNYILQIQELYEKSKLYLYKINKVIRKAKIVFMPEYNRTVLYQIWFNLKYRPIVLANKPYFIPSDNILEQLALKYKDKLSIFYTKKVILYQGWIGRDRDLTNYIKGIKKIGDDFQIVLLGKDCGMIEEYKKIEPNIIHYDFIPAPDYLIFTKFAHMGIVSYDPLLLNSAYCAPNKIYEYAAFSLPMLGNDIPGLKTIFEKYRIGLIIDETQIDSIVSAIDFIDKNINDFRKDVNSFWVETDNVEVVGKALTSLSRNNYYPEHEDI